MRVIDVLADKHEDWINMAKSFGVSEEDANELVQQMYIRITDYVSEVNKILYNETEVNTYYVYVTLRNLYLSRHHKNNPKVEYIEEKDNFDQVISNENIEEQKIKFDDIFNKIDSITKEWYWYDKRIFNIHFYDEMSMRKISRETKISLSSIFNTLSNGKEKIRKGAVEEYKKWLKSRS
jgi:RNA polymerase sigma factor (sigma-70 family)